MVDTTGNLVTSNIGNKKILDNRKSAILCSKRCPGEIILRTHDLFKAGAGSIAIAGGFHSPLERECLRLLIRNKQPVIYCPARSIENMRIPAQMKRPLADGRLLILSPFAESVRRQTVKTAMIRNRFAADISDCIFIPYAEPGGKTEQLALELTNEGRTIYTIDSKYNENLVDAGANTCIEELWNRIVIDLKKL